MFLLMGLTGCNSNADPLPKVKSIDRMTATSYQDQKDTQFDVPQEHWESILDALRPAKRDRSPAKWWGLGRLDIKLKGGRSLVVMLYRTHDGPGAFAAGGTFAQRVYYRGGDSEKLEKAFRAAYSASQIGRVEKGGLSE